jgi:O-antigen ligase
MFNYFKVSKFFLILPVLAVAIVTTTTLFPFIVGKYVWFRTSIDLALISFLLGVIFSAEARLYLGRLAKLFRSPLVIAVTAFATAFVLACFFGFRPSFSFWSNFERGEGGFQMIHLYIFFIMLATLFKEEEDWYRIFGWSVVGGLCLALYSLFSGLGFQGFIGSKFGDPSYRLAGSIGNPAYVAAYSIYTFFYCLYILVGKYRGRLLSIGGVTVSLLLASSVVVFILAATRGAFIGLLVAILAFLFYFAYSHKSWRKWLIVAGVAMILLVVVAVNFKDTAFVKAIPGSRIFDLSFSTQTFRDRRVVWQMAWDGFKAKPVFGWGPENFIDVFDRIFNIEFYRPPEQFGAWFDRAHSIYLDYLVETGLVGLLSFLSIFVVFYIKFFRISRDDKALAQARHDHGAKNQRPAAAGYSNLTKSLVFAMPFAYLVQGLVLFDVLVIYINTFLFLAFSVYFFDKLKTKNGNA